MSYILFSETSMYSTFRFPFFFVTQQVGPPFSTWNRYNLCLYSTSSSYVHILINRIILSCTIKTWEYSRIFKWDTKRSLKHEDPLITTEPDKAQRGRLLPCKVLNLWLRRTYLRLVDLGKLIWNGLITSQLLIG